MQNAKRGVDIPGSQDPWEGEGSRRRGRAEAETKWRKKGGWEGKKNSIFVKREKDLVENFYWGFLNLKKKITKKDKKKKQQRNYFGRFCLPLGHGQGHTGLRTHTTGPGADAHRHTWRRVEELRGQTQRRQAWGDTGVDTGVQTESVSVHAGAGRSTADPDEQSRTPGRAGTHELRAAPALPWTFGVPLLPTDSVTHPDTRYLGPLWRQAGWRPRPAPQHSRPKDPGPEPPPPTRAGTPRQ